MNWSAHEWKNQIYHFIVGLGVSWLYCIVVCLISGIFMPYGAVLVSLSVWITVEVCQYLYADSRQLKLDDRIRDTVFAVLGGSTIYILRVYHVYQIFFL